MSNKQRASLIIAAFSVYVPVISVILAHAIAKDGSNFEQIAFGSNFSSFEPKIFVTLFAVYSLRILVLLGPAYVIAGGWRFFNVIKTTFYACLPFEILLVVTALNTSFSSATSIRPGTTNQSGWYGLAVFGLVSASCIAQAIAMAIGYLRKVKYV